MQPLAQQVAVGFKSENFFNIDKTEYWDISKQPNERLNWSTNKQRN